MSETLNLVLEFNTKIFIFIVLFMYFLISLYLSYRLVPAGTSIVDVPISSLVVATGLRIISAVFLFFYPLYTIVFLFSGVGLVDIMNYIFIAYGIMGTLIGIVGFIFGFEKLLDMFGLQGFNQKDLIKRKRLNLRRR